MIIKLAQKTTQAIIRAFKQDLDVSVKQVNQSKNPYHFTTISGKGSNGESEWYVYSNINKAKQNVKKHIQDLIASEDIKLFNKNWLTRYVSISDLDIKLMAEDHAENYLDDLKEEEILEQAGNFEQYEELLSNIEDIEEFKTNLIGFDLTEKIRLQKVVEQSTPVGSNLQEKLNYVEKKITKDDDILDLREQLDYFKEKKEKELSSLIEESKTLVLDRQRKRWEKGLKTPLEFLIEKEELYSLEELLKETFIKMDMETLVKDAIALKGLGYFLDTFDRKGIVLKDPVTKKSFYVFGLN